MMNSNVLLFPAAQEPDSIFFSKADFHVGRSLRFYGRGAERGKLYFIQSIRTIEHSGGVLTSVRVSTPARLADRVTLREAITGQTRILSFAYLSYSAIWRLED